jgi:CRP-like cAMP-binding protein
MDLTEEEKAALRRLEKNVVRFRKRATIVRDSDRFRHVFIIQSGWAIRHRVEQKGGRQIFSFILPGDFTCLNAAFFKRATSTVMAITPIVASCCDPKQIREITRIHPRLGWAVARCNAHDQSILREHLVNIGRRTAHERVAHLLMETWRRLDAVGQATCDGYGMAINQEVIADAVGLSAVHVNRVLRRMRAEGLIDGGAPYARVIQICDVEGLRRAAGFDEGYLHFGDRIR